MLTTRAGVSHLDHGLTEAQLAHVLATFADRSAFFVETVELPEHLGTVPNALYGPACGDLPVTDANGWRPRYMHRSDRAWESCVVDLPTRPTRLLTVVGGPIGDAPCVLYTAYGGPAAPQESGELELQRMAASDAHSDACVAWRNAGRPQGGELFNAMQRAGQALDAAVRRLGDSLVFWREHALAAAQ